MKPQQVWVLGGLFIALAIVIAASVVVDPNFLTVQVAPPIAEGPEGVDGDGLWMGLPRCPGDADVVAAAGGDNVVGGVDPAVALDQRCDNAACVVNLPNVGQVAFVGNSPCEGGGAGSCVHQGVAQTFNTKKCPIYIDDPNNCVPQADTFVAGDAECAAFGKPPGCNPRVTLYQEDTQCQACWRSRPDESEADGTEPTYGCTSVPGTEQLKPYRLQCQHVAALPQADGWEVVRNLSCDFDERKQQCQGTCEVKLLDSNNSCQASQTLTGDCTLIPAGVPIIETLEDLQNIGTQPAPDAGEAPFGGGFETPTAFEETIELINPF